MEAKQNKQEILDAWAKAQAEGTPMAQFVKEVQGTPLQVSVGSLRNWTLGRNNKGSTKAAPRAISHTAPSRLATSRTGANLIQEFEAQYKEQKDQALLAFLEDAVKGLEAQLAAAQSQLRNHREAMGLIEPSVDE